jgi:hypothetical protein
MGSVIGKVFEKFYEEEWFKDHSTLETRAKERLHSALEKQLDRNFIDWELISKRDMIDICQKGVNGMIATIKGNRLLGNLYSRSEFEIGGKITSNIEISGKVDLIFGHTQTGVTILDGKNGKRNSKGAVRVDSGQLKFYALCYYTNYGKLPDRVGWLYFRYPYGMPKEDGGIETGVEWFPVSDSDLKKMCSRIIDMQGKVQRKLFDARPKQATCGFCDYASVCNAYKQHQDELALKRASKPKPFADLMGPTVYDFGVDGFEGGSE